MNVAARREQLHDLLGDLPPRDRTIGVQVISQSEQRGYYLERLVLDLNGVERVPAYFVKPLNAKGKLPTIIFNHAHGGDYRIGKQELLDGRGSVLNEPWAQALTKHGWAALCIDHWAFGERRGREEANIFKLMLWRGQVMWGMMIYDTLRATDYAVTRDDVDSSRLASIGLSMGSTMAWWHAALDERVKVCVDQCCLTDVHTLAESGNLAGHSIYYFVPGQLKYFSTSDINALIAPRAHLAQAGRYDTLAPEPGLHLIDANMKKVYAQAGSADAWTLSIYDCGHMETVAMRAEALGYLQKWL